jgi:peptidoglycan hydrolase CwlO-like protein
MNNIQDDPALTGIFTRHILFHGEDMSIKIKLQNILDQVTKAEASVKSNTGEIWSNAKKIKDLEKDVKKLQ